MTRNLIDLVTVLSFPAVIIVLCLLLGSPA